MNNPSPSSSLRTYFFLAPSNISGVGVFARVALPKNTSIEHMITDDATLVTDTNDQKLLDIYCVKSKEGYWCPKDFSRPSFWWYINHSDTPNISCKDNVFITMRDIAAGEELTIDYRELDEEDNLHLSKPSDIIKQ